MNTLIQLFQLHKAWKNDLPQDSARLYNELCNHYLEEHNLKALGKLILFANKQGYYVLRDMSKIVLQSIVDGMNSAINDNNIPMVAVFSLILFHTKKTLYIDNEEIDWKELFNVDSEIWSTDLTKYSWVIKESEITELFNNELYAAIGLEMRQYQSLYDHYSQTDNRAAQAYLLTMIAVENYRDPDLAALEKIMRDYGDLQVAGEAAIQYYRYKKWCDSTAESINKENKTAQSQYRFLTDAIKRWGDWCHADQLKDYLKELCSISIENINDIKQVWYESQPKHICLKCRNAQELCLIVYETSLTAWDAVDMDDEDKVEKIIGNKKSILQFEVEKHNIAPYLFETREFNLDSLPIGTYIIELRINNKVRKFIRQQVSNLILVANEESEKKTRFAVLNAKSGFPVEGAVIRKVERYSRRKNNKPYTENSCNKDAEALFSYNHYDDIVAYTPTDKSAFCDNIYSWVSWNKNREENLVKILTDRSIYRPGQCVHIAVLTYFKTDDNKLNTVAKMLPLTITNAKHKTLLKKALTTDDFGVAHVDFSIPDDIPTGKLNINAGNIVNYSVRVEEYKRPTFEVTLNPYHQSYKAEDTIQLTGQAQSYAGVPISGAMVKYKVVRRRAHWWWFYSQYWGYEGSQYEREGEHIDNGTCLTASDGSFSMQVKLELPYEKDEYGYYDFVVIADVADNTGETHSAEIVFPLSNREYFLSCNVPEKKELHEQSIYRIVLTNVGGEEIQAQVQVQIDNNKPLLVSPNTDLMLPQLGVGQHTIQISYKEEKLERSVLVVDKQSLKPAIETDDWYYCSAKRFTKGEPLYLQVGTSSPDTYILYCILSDHEVIERGHVVASDGMLNLQLQFKDEYKYGIRACFAWVKNAEFHHAEFSILPPEEKLDLQMHWETFRNRLKPGTHETWRLRITENDIPVAANLIATLYDKSLEQLLPHSWRHVIPDISWHIPDAKWDTHDIHDNYIQYFEYYRSYPKHRLASDSLENACCSAAPPSGCSDADEGNEQTSKKIQLRTNFAETAFFMPQLRTDENGDISIEFDLPDTLTTWCFKGFAHTREMHHAFITDEVIAQKPMMLQPNLPRFMRAGDAVVLSAKVTNLSGKDLAGSVQISLQDAESEQVVFCAEQQVKISANQTENVAFNYAVSSEYSSLICTIVVIGEDFSDGERHQIPVLSNTEEVVATHTFSQTEVGKYAFPVQDLVPQSSTHRRLSADYTANPFWLAYKALPQIVEPNPENVISIVIALYCSCLTKHIQRLLAMTDIGETYKTFDLISKLKRLQKQDGSFAWYIHMHSSSFITAEVMMHLSRLVHITQDSSALEKIMSSANAYLDIQMCKEVKGLKKHEKEGKTTYFPSYTCLQHLYNCALQKRELTGETKEAYDYLVQLLKKDIHIQTIREKAMTALILEYNGEHRRAAIYAESLYQYTTFEPQKGRWFDTPRASYSWMSYKIPTHVLVMEVLHTLRPDDSQTLGEMQIWLLQEKRTQQWETPLDSVNAVHALLFTNKEHLAAENMFNAVQIYADNACLSIEFQGREKSAHVDLENNTKQVVFNKLTQGLSWGVVSAQFMQPLQDVTAQGGDMILRREILTDTENLHVGDRIRIRLELECKRNFDMVEIRDVRASCMEPVNQLTRNDSFVHIAPHDTETIYSYLGISEGTHAIETEYFLTRPGTYQLGLATAQCCYAPEFRTTAPSETIVIRE